MNMPQKKALDYLQANTVITLAVFYASEGFDLYFLSAPQSRHAKALAQSGRAAITIQDNNIPWTEIKGIQAEGSVVCLAGDERQRAIKVYSKQHPLVLEPPTVIARALAKVSWYQITPDCVYFINNSAGFGRRARIVG